MAASTDKKKPTYIFKCPVAGDGAVGKTSLIVRYTQGTFTDTYKMTIGTSFAVKTVDFGDVLVKLQIWDLAGQPHFGGVRPLFYQGSTGVIYVFSVTDRASFDHLSGWLEEARKNAGNVPGVLIGNKTDLVDQRIVTLEEAKGLADSLGFTYIETSAKLDENVGDAFKEIALTIIKTKWPEWAPEEAVVPPVVEEPVSEVPPPAEPAISEPAAAEPALEEELVVKEPPELEAIEPVSEEPESLEIPEPIPEPVEAEPTELVEPEPIPEPVEAEPTELVEPEPIPVPPEPKPEILTESLEPEEEPVTELPAEIQPVPELPPEEADIIIETKTESTLFEFEGVDPQTVSDDMFEQRTIMAMRRLGVSETGVLGTFLRSLIRQGQRDVVIQSLESLQEEQI